MRLSTEQIVALERIAARAWPAAQEAEIGGWRLYASSGFSGRVNACWPLEEPGLPLADAIAAVEAWYRQRALPSRFKTVEGAVAPAELTNHLSALGYQMGPETLMMAGPTIGRSDPGVSLSESADETFAAVFAATSDDPGDARERLETLARIPRPRIFARVDVAGAPAAIGACAVEGDRAGVFAMRTEPGQRRRGLARRVFGALLARAAELGATSAWLQVEAGNGGAIDLYAAAGFEAVYRYRYWMKLAKT